MHRFITSIPFCSFLPLYHRVLSKATLFLEAQSRFSPCFPAAFRLQWKEKESVVLMMKFCWTTLHVADFEKSLAFYRELIGLPVASRVSYGPVSIAMLGPEEAPKIELIHEEGALCGQGQGVTIGFETDSLARATALLEEHGFPLKAGPVSPNPHIRFSFFSDPDGYEVQLVENL